MNRLIFAFLGTIFLSVFSCKKDSYEPIIPNPSSYITTGCFIVSEQNDTVKTEYEYNTANRIITQNTYFNDVLYEKTNYTYQANSVTVTSNKNQYVYKYFLNKKGFADSIAITYEGYIYLKQYFINDANGLPLQTTITGTVISQPYEEITYNEYSNNNIVKSKTITDGNESTTIYEYYLDSLNTMGATNQAKLFVRQGKNLLKKVMYDDSSFVSYQYSINEEGNWVVSTLNENEEVNDKTIKLHCN